LSDDNAGDPPTFKRSDYESEPSSNSRVKREIDSWRPYVEALREEDRQIFREMMNSVSGSYREAIDNSERGYDTEALLMSIILNQQKTINWLSILAKRARDGSAATFPR